MWNSVKYLFEIKIKHVIIPKILNSGSFQESKFLAYKETRFIVDNLVVD